MLLSDELVVAVDLTRMTLSLSPRLLPGPVATVFFRALCFSTL